MSRLSRMTICLSIEALASMIELAEPAFLYGVADIEIDLARMKLSTVTGTASAARPGAASGIVSTATKCKACNAIFMSALHPGGRSR